MRKFAALFIGMGLICSSAGCGGNTETATNPVAETQISTTGDPAESDDKTMNKELILKINDTEVDVVWAENASVTALKAHAENGLTINMSMYGGFEQVGSLGAALPSEDERITTYAGDIVLYSSNQIVIFYGSNTWAYTKLGHIDLSESDLADLLGEKNVTITISLK